MDIRFTLQAQYAGAEYTAGPFNLYGYTATTSVSAFTLASGITKQQLLTGYTVTTGLNIVSGYIQSTGTCSTTPPEAYTLQFSGGPVIIGTFSNYGANSDVGIVKLDVYSAVPLITRTFDIYPAICAVLTILPIVVAAEVSIETAPV